MRYFPMFLDLVGRDVLIAGGGEQAAQKLRLISRTQARIALMAPELVPELEDAVAAGQARHIRSVLDPAEAPALVFCCSGCVGTDGIVAFEARLRGALVNVVDRPALCDAITPALVDRDPLVIAIGTEGAAPVMARQVKSSLETMLEPGIGRLVALAGRLRPIVGEAFAAPLRRRFWAWVFAGTPRRLFRDGREEAAAEAIEEAARSGRLGDEGGGALTSVQLRGAPDLLPLRALQRLQEADLILHGEPVPDAELELARRDAERGPLDGAVARAAVAEGQRVVWLAEEPLAGSDEVI